MAHGAVYIVLITHIQPTIIATYNIAPSYSRQERNAQLMDFEVHSSK